MAIYAQRTAFRSSANIPDIKIVGGTPNNKDILIWSATEQAFVNGNISCILPAGYSGSGGSGSGGIIDGYNIGSGAEVFAGLDSFNDIMDFRTITGSDGITVLQDSKVIGEINITNDIITNASISVPNSFSLTIDNDNTTYNTAVFELFSNYSVGKITLNPVSFSSNALELQVIADTSHIAHGQFKTINGDFIAAGFESGMCLKVDGTNEQDGIWTIESVTTDTITITVPFPDASDAGFQPPTTLQGLNFNVVDANTIQITGSDLTTFGFSAGLDIIIAGTVDNDGTYTVSNVSGDTITLSDSLPGSFGCDVSTISIYTVPDTLPTGWYVNELGEMVANDTSINGSLNVTENFILQGIHIDDYIDMFIPVFPDNGLITQLSQGVFVGRELVGTNGITVTNPDGLAGDPTISANDFVITLGGELQGSVTITGLSDGILNASLASLPQFSGLAGHSYNRVTIDGAGRVVNGSNQTILGVNGISVANGDGLSGSPVVSAPNFDITLNGDVFGSGTVYGLSNVAIDLHLPELIVPGTFNTITVDSKGRVIAGSTNPLNFQPHNNNLDDIANGFVDEGVVVWDGSQYISRIVKGATGEISVANGDGQIADITIGIANDATIPGTGALTIPKGSDTQRPGVPTNGMIRYSTTTSTYEVYIDGNWKDILVDGAITEFLPLAGGTMLGNISMGANNITFSTGLVDGRDVGYDGSVLDNINTGTGIKVQTAADTFENRTIEATPFGGIVVTNGDGISSNPEIALDLSNTLNGNLEPNYNNDTVVYYDSSSGETKMTSVGKINRRPAFRYFMAQL